MDFSKRHLNALFYEAPDALSYQRIILTEDGRPCDYEFIAINHAMEKLFQIERQDVVGKTFCAIHPATGEGRQRWLQLAKEVALHKNVISVDIYDRWSKKWLLVTFFSLDTYYFATRYIDITAGNPRVRDIIANPLCLLDTSGKWLRVNRQFAKTLGYQENELENTSSFALLHPDDIAPTQAALASLSAQADLSGFINRYRSRDGAYRYLEWRARPDGDLVYAAAQDITAVKLKEIELQHSNAELLQLTDNLKASNESLLSLATRDKLTGLYNRHFFEEIATETMEVADRNNEPLSLIIFDLDHFKKVNDTWGHPVGDDVLRQTALTTADLMRKADFLSRVGGEEFAVILPHTDKNGALAVAEKIRAALDQDLHPKAGRVSGSFGVAERLKAESLRRWYKRCDEALYQAKLHGRNRVMVCEQAERALVTIQLEWHDAWSCGHPLIDEQHQQLIEFAHTLLGAFYSGAAPSVSLAWLDKLLAHIALHFESEEKILQQSAYPELEQHARLHEALAQKASYLKKSYLQGGVTAAAFFSFIIDDIVVGHMLKEDAKFSALLRKLRDAENSEVKPHSGRLCMEKRNAKIE